MKRPVLLGVAAALALGAAVGAQSARPAARPPSRDWPNTGNDPGSMKFSPLTQITPGNVAQLAQAWTYDMGVPAAGYTITPIVVGNVLYLPVNGTVITALQADSGRELWKYDLKNLKDIGPNPSAGGRGISYWTGTTRIPPRIVINTTNGLSLIHI